MRVAQKYPDPAMREDLKWVLEMPSQFAGSMERILTHMREAIIESESHRDKGSDS